MEFTQNTVINLSPAAMAVLVQPPAPDQLPRRFATSCAPGDYVVIQECGSLFQVVQREWTIGEHFETLTVLLDLAPLQAPLRAVT